MPIALLIRAAASTDFNFTFGFLFTYFFGLFPLLVSLWLCYSGRRPTGGRGSANCFYIKHYGMEPR